MAEPVRILYVMGHGWSGSTILGNLLGELNGFFHAGELRRLWGEALPANAPCGCGQPVRDCPVWSNVLAHPLLAGLDPVVADRRHLAVTPVRRTLRLLKQGRGRVKSQNESHFESSSASDLSAHLDATARLYRAIADVTEARVIVDTSKRSGDAAALLLTPEVNAFFLHLVRDPRAVAHSWARRPDGSHGPVATARDWMAFNWLDERVRRAAGKDRSMRVRYEDLMAAPAPSLRAVAGLVGEKPETLPLRGDREARLGVNHGVMGNPSRFATGEVELREDDDWKRAQPAGDRRLVAALTLPAMVRYGYPVGRTRP
jgi:hypothetical protein